MEQDIQQNIQKLPLPIKTKIAAWVMIIIGISLSIMGLIINNSLPEDSYPQAHRDLLFGNFFGFLLIVSSIFLLIRISKKAWWIAITINLIFIITTILIQFLSLLLFILIIPFIIPFILLLLDRKNFWKIAT